MKFELIKYFTYYLALQKCNKKSNYTIHGLWIDYNRGGYPEYCNKTEFDISLLNPIRNDLEKYWPGCYGNNKDLWEHEWRKHGTCFYPRIGLVEYFNKTLQLFLQKGANNCIGACMIQIDYDEL
jgi:ribonuclease T2